MQVVDGSELKIDHDVDSRVEAIRSGEYSFERRDQFTEIGIGSSSST